MQRDRIKKLAERIDELAAKDRLIVDRERQIGELRRQAAAELHRVCAGFVGELNKLLSHTEVLLAPAEYSPASFRDPGPNLFQIDVRGRILQIEFQATDELISTEEFRVPYVLEGAIRCFNQQLLDKNLIVEHLLFYCLEKNGGLWRFFDARTYRPGPFDPEYLAALFEQLV